MSFSIDFSNPTNSLTQYEKFLGRAERDLECCRKEGSARDYSTLCTLIKGLADNLPRLKIDQDIRKRLLASVTRLQEGAEQVAKERGLSTLMPSLPLSSMRSLGSPVVAPVVPKGSSIPSSPGTHAPDSAKLEQLIEACAKTRTNLEQRLTVYRNPETRRAIAEQIEDLESQRSQAEKEEREISDRLTVLYAKIKERDLLSRELDALGKEKDALVKKAEEVQDKLLSAPVTRAPATSAPATSAPATPSESDITTRIDQLQKEYDFLFAQMETFEEVEYEIERSVEQCQELRKHSASLSARIEEFRAEVATLDYREAGFSDLLRETNQIFDSLTARKMAALRAPERADPSSSSRVPARVTPMSGIGLADLPATFTLQLDSIAEERNPATRSRLIRERLKAADIRKADLRELYIAIGSPHTRTQDYYACEHFCYMHIGNHIEQLKAFIADKKRAAAL